MDNKIYKEAILDAKALRAGAIANAKSIMQEALEPAIQEMMRLKLSEELEEEIEEGYEEEGIEEYGDEHAVATKDALEKNEGEMYDEEVEEVTDATLEEILAELDALEEDQLNEAEEDEVEDEEESEEGEEAEEDEEGVTDDTKVVQLTLGDLKAALMPQAAEMGDEAGEESEEAPLSLDEILAEMEAEKYEEAIEEESKEPVKEFMQSQGASQAFGEMLLGLARKVGIPVEGIDATTIGTAVGSVAGAAGLITSAIVAGNWDKIKAIISSALGKIKGKSALAEAGKDHGIEEELKTAKETIAELRESINEINLLNAKLLYMNKIFKAKSLTESEKVKVVKAFDRNASIKEVKNTYETLSESFKTKKSQVIKESVGFASKPIGVAPKTNIVEADAFVNRWQKIAGIK
jgi:hypothetical protein